MIGKFLRAGVAHRDDRLHEFTEEFSALGFLVHATAGRPSRTISVSRSHPKSLPQNRSEKSGERARFFADKKCLLSGIREYLDWRSFFSSSKPTSASMIARNPRSDAPVSFLTCQRASVRSPVYQNFVVHSGADN